MKITPDLYYGCWGVSDMKNKYLLNFPSSVALYLLLFKTAKFFFTNIRIYIFLRIKFLESFV